MSGEELRAALKAAETDRYGHTEADHEAAGACRRPSLAARVAASATELAMGSDAAVAFQRGWDAALVEARAPYDRLTADLRKLAEELEGEARACFEEAKRFVDDGLYRDLRGRALAKSQVADRLCAVVAAAEEAKA